MKLSKLLKGKFGEQKVAELYAANGFTIIANNFFNHRGKSVGELDIIVTKNSHIHFIEVKTRFSNSFGEAIESITAQKIRRIHRAIRFFLAHHPQFSNYNQHLDIALVEFNQFDKTRQKIRIHTDVIDDILAEV